MIEDAKNIIILHNLRFQDIEFVGFCKGKPVAALKEGGTRKELVFEVQSSCHVQWTKATRFIAVY